MTFLDRAVKFLLPREDHFFDLLERGARHARESAEHMVSLCSAPTASEREAALVRLRDVEHAADAVIHDVYDALNRTFVTPLDRSDIYALANHLEEVVDLNHATAMQVVVHAIDDVPAGSSELADLILKGANEVQAAVALLRRLRDLDRVREHTRALSRLEHEGDDIFRARVAALFRDEKNAIRLIQHKEFLEGLERSLDAIDHVGTALMTIVIKNA
jgi:uncharacterized protein Yka (UPF0111/DUF47 family)